MEPSLRPPPIRSFHLNTMVRVSGVVTRRTGVFPQLKIIMFDCAKCGHVLGPFTQVWIREGRWEDVKCMISCV